MTVYAITNDVNSKRYVGACQIPLRQRWSGHRSKAKHGSHHFIHAAMREIGIERFKVIVLWHGETSVEELKNLEKYYIRALGTQTPGGYNETDGGWSRVCRPCSPEKAAKISSTLMGHPVSAETKEKIRTSPCSISFLGKHHSPEARRRISDGHRGKVASLEARRRMSEAAKRRCSKP